MSNPKTTIILAAVSLIPMTAFAERLVPVSVEIEYDAAALSTNQGAIETMNSISSTITAACQVKQSISAASRTDKKCVEDLTAQAIRKITSATADAGLAIAPAFLKSEEKILAAHEQR